MDVWRLDRRIDTIIDPNQEHLAEGRGSVTVQRGATSVQPFVADYVWGADPIVPRFTHSKTERGFVIPRVITVMGIQVSSIRLRKKKELQLHVVAGELPNSLYSDHTGPPSGSGDCRSKETVCHKSANAHIHTSRQSERTAPISQ